MHNFSEIAIVIQLTCFVFFFFFLCFDDLPLFYHGKTRILYNISKLYFITIFHNLYDLFCNAQFATSTW